MEALACAVFDDAEETFETLDDGDAESFVLDLLDICFRVGLFFLVFLE